MSQVDEIDGATAKQQPHEVLAPSVTGTELRILPFEDADPVRQFATITFLRGGLIAIAITLVGGLLGALYSVPSLAPTFQSLGLDLRQLRPVHTTFAQAKRALEVSISRHIQPSAIM